MQCVFAVVSRRASGFMHIPDFLDGRRGTAGHAPRAGVQEGAQGAQGAQAQAAERALRRDTRFARDATTRDALEMIALQAEVLESVRTDKMAPYYEFLIAKYGFAADDALPARSRASRLAPAFAFAWRQRSNVFRSRYCLRFKYSCSSLAASCARYAASPARSLWPARSLTSVRVAGRR